MSLMSRLFGYATKEEAAGSSLEDQHPWVIPPSRDATAILRSLPALFPRDAFVYFEGPAEARFAGWLVAHVIPPPLKIAYGTIWPKPDCYHIPLVAALLEEAAVLVDREGVALPCLHLHVHDGVQVLLEWHDAFVDDPMYVASIVPRDRVEAFARAIGVSPVSQK